MANLSKVERLLKKVRLDEALEQISEGKKQSRNVERWRRLEVEAVQRLVKLGRYRKALEVLDEIESEEAMTPRLWQQKGVALARFGHLREAQDVLGALVKAGHRDPETLGIYARTWMDRYDKTGGRAHLRQSRKLYAEAFKRKPEDYYTGINAAAKSVFLGDLRAAKRYGKRVEKLVGTRPKAGDYWHSATVAEVQLIQQNYAAAARLYRQAVAIAPDEVGSHSSTWLQARRLMDALETPAAARRGIEAAFEHLKHLPAAPPKDAKPGRMVSEPPCRRLRVYAFDPSLARRMETATINEVTLRIPWEAEPAGGRSALQPGPVGEYLEIVDYDPASGCFYEPIDLDDQRLLATDGMAPSEGDPKFHQQMVYGVAMNVIDHFEKALGRRALWADAKDDTPGFLQRLRIYPHGVREANAFYSPEKRAILFGYFPVESGDPSLFPGGTVFTCLSHDVIAHEMSHALLDGLHPRFAEPSNPDVLALHEAFADIVALFQHFSHPEVLRHEIARTRGDFTAGSVLGQLAQEFGRAIGRYGALRDALGEVDRRTGTWRLREPKPEDLAAAQEPHDRGAILVAAIFEAFLAIYNSRIADLLRLATRGSGILAPGAIHPDLVVRLADEAAKSARHILHICIRALDYCPPVDITFGDYLRAIITADVDLVPDDRLHYRLAIIEAFQRRGIYPSDVRNLSVESLVWRPPRGRAIDLTPLFRSKAGRATLEPEWRPTEDRRDLWDKMTANKKIVHDWFAEYCPPDTADELGLSISTNSPKSIYGRGGRTGVEVHSVRVARRTAPSGGQVADYVIEILQRRQGYFDREKQERVDRGRRRPPRNAKGTFTFWGGCTLLVDPDTCQVRYAVNKHILSTTRLEKQRRFLSGESGSLRATYFGDPYGAGRPVEPFALLHRPTEG